MWMAPNMKETGWMIGKKAREKSLIKMVAFIQGKEADSYCWFDSFVNKNIPCLYIYFIVWWMTEWMSREWLMDTPNGHGQMVWPDGTKYTGEWKFGLRYISELNVEFSYVKFDRWYFCFRHGKGKLETPLGTYEGDWENDQVHSEISLLFSLFSLFSKINQCWRMFLALKLQLCSDMVKVFGKQKMVQSSLVNGRKIDDMVKENSLKRQERQPIKCGRMAFWNNPEFDSSVQIYQNLPNFCRIFCICEKIHK